jgi:WD40 repeat protein
MPRVSRRHLVDVFSHELPDFPRGLAFSPDAAWLTVGAADGTLRVLKSSSGALGLEVKLPGSVSAVAFNPSGEQLAIACHDGTTRLCVRAEGAWALGPVLPVGERVWVEHLAWSSTGILATAAGKKVRLWTATGAPVLETEPHESTVTGVAFSRDGRSLFTTSYGGVRVWPLEAHVESRHFPWKGSLISLAVSPDDAVIACGSQDCSVHFWRVETGSDSEMTGYPAKPTALAWSADSALLATGGSDVICVWGFENGGPEGKKPLLLKGHERLVTQLAFGPKERLLASAGDDRDVLLWSLSEGLKPVGLCPMGASVTELAFSPDGVFLAAADHSGQVKVWTPTKERS